MSTLPAGLAKLILPFACLFSRWVFQSVQVLLAGAILAPGKRTVASVLRIMGLSQERHFQTNRAVWSSLAASRILLQLLVLVRGFAPQGPLVFALDDTIDRRWGARIAARGIYRDPVRSSRSHFVKVSGHPAGMNTLANSAAPPSFPRPRKTPRLQQRPRPVLSAL